MRTIKLLLIMHVGLLVGVPSSAEQITVDYIATVATVSGTPFGIDPNLGTAVTGSFTYDTATLDVLGDMDLGDYPHAAGGGFAAIIQGYGVTISGSTTPYLQVENLDPDTFRFIDGPRIVGPAGGVMFVNAVPDSTVQLWIAITAGSGSVFDDDSLPEVFPFTFPGPPHTFSLGDSLGTLLLQISGATTPTQPITWGQVKAIYGSR
jgi:hypothetical protein